MPSILPEYVCHRAPGAIVIDGCLNEAAWASAETIELARNGDGVAPAQRTACRLLWDDAFLYVAFECEDRYAWATMRERDAHLWEEEVVEVFIDANGNGRLYFEFEVNPLNTQLDLLVVKRLGRLPQPFFEWDCHGWESAVSVVGAVGAPEDGRNDWRVEMRIPLAEIYTAPHPPRPGDRWRLGLYRIDRPDGGVELSAWSPTYANTFHVPERFGVLVFAE